MGAKTLLTVEHLERLPETGGTSYLHNRIRDRLIQRLMNYLDAQKDPSEVVSEQWFQLREDVVGTPDVALIAPSQLPLLEPEHSIQPFSPALAIEIISPSNTFDELARKIQEYLEAGTRAVWIFVTAKPEILVYSATAHPAILTAADLLEDAALLPGFSAQVEELFAV